MVVRINSLNTSNSKELQDFVGRTIYVWFYILLLSLFAQNFDNSNPPYDITFHIPHAITIVEDTEKFDVKKYGEELEVDKTFI